MMEEALVKRLLATVALTPLVGNRIYWQRRPGPNDLPAITLSTAGEDRMYNHDGPDGLQETRIQIDVRAKDMLEAKKVSRLVLFELESGETVDGVTFGDAIQQSSLDAPRENLGGGTEVYRVTRDVNIFWSQQ